MAGHRIGWEHAYLGPLLATLLVYINIPIKDHNNYSAKDEDFLSVIF